MKCVLKKLTFAVIATIAVFVVPGVSLAQETEAPDWQPTSVFEGKYDWIQMESREWIKGKVLIMYNDQLEFDSDEFGDLKLGWEDIRQLRSVQPLTLGLIGRQQVVGTIVLRDGVITVTGESSTTEIARDDVLSITAGAPRELNFWTAEIFFGLTARAGNSDTFDYNGQLTVRRRTVSDRIAVEYLGNRSTSGKTQLSDNDRVDASWDHVIGKRFFLRPVFGQYYRDPFQNLSHRLTVGAGAGYTLIDGKKVTWNVFAGPAYQTVSYVDVPAGESASSSTPAFVFGTDAEWNITKWLEFDGSHGFQIVDRESGSYNHHMVVSLEAEITRLLDFDVTVIWDRVQNPRADSSGQIPLQDDWRAVLGLTFDF